MIRCLAMPLRRETKLPHQDREGHLPDGCQLRQGLQAPRLPSLDVVAESQQLSVLFARERLASTLPVERLKPPRHL